MQAFHLLGPAPFYTNSFLLISDAGHAVIIDPAAEVQEYDKILKEHNAQLTTILCTHGHYDHVGSAGTLRREHKARLYCEPVDCRGTQLLPLKAADVDSGYEEGETIAVDELDVVEVAVGQKVKITVDALSDAEMDGEVYKIAPVGSNSGGVTTYDVELTFDAAGHGVDFVFRYCNPMMAVVEGVPVENMVNRSFYEVFPDGDRKWLVSCADTALNGSCHTLRDYSRELEQNLTIHCYQPEFGYCASASS